MGFTAGWNMPGYLPETNPAYFETFGEAKWYLVDIMESFDDSDAMISNEDDASNFPDNYSALLANIKVWASPRVSDSWGGYTADQRLYFWIDIASEDYEEGERDLGGDYEREILSDYAT